MKNLLCVLLATNLAIVCTARQQKKDSSKVSLPSYLKKKVQTIKPKNQALFSTAKPLPASTPRKKVRFKKPKKVSLYFTPPAIVPDEDVQPTPFTKDSTKQ